VQRDGDVERDDSGDSAARLEKAQLGEPLSLPGSERSSANRGSRRSILLAA
jgi:hypothetical protein